jgi:hypothetical protein
MITYEEFKLKYKLFHTCGFPTIPYEVSYSSDCPQCNPDSKQWEEQCKEEYSLGHIHYQNGIWGKYDI